MKAHATGPLIKQNNFYTKTKRGVIHVRITPLAFPNNYSIKEIFHPTVFPSSTISCRNGYREPVPREAEFPPESGYSPTMRPRYAAMPKSYRSAYGPAASSYVHRGNATSIGWLGTTRNSIRTKLPTNDPELRSKPRNRK